MPTTMDWPRLLTRSRLREKSKTRAQIARTDFERDYDRILFSNAFRRLHDKTQVFPMPENDHIHTRLTHSLEVACVGRSLGKRCGQIVLERFPDLTKLNIHPSDFGGIVSAACLAHDIGNPPFGHSGEDAIGTWFQDPVNRTHTQLIPEKEQADLEAFEGNAQGFRHLVRLQIYKNNGGMQLTLPTLGAFSKYPQESIAPKPDDKASQKKYGYFQSEAEYFEEIADNLGLIRRKTKAKSWHRHPLAFLMEAADDICYRILDLEDGFILRKFTFDEYYELTKSIVSLHSGFKLTRQNDRDDAAYIRAIAINELTNQTAEAFGKFHDEILNGRFDAPLIKKIPSARHLKTIKDASVELCYNAYEVSQIEVTGFHVIGNLLNKFIPAVLHSKSKRTPVDPKLLRILPDKISMDTSPYNRILLVTDFISGMTDSFAVNLYRKLHGVSLPTI